MERPIEFADDRHPKLSAFGDFIQIFFHVCGKLEIDNFGKMLNKNVVDDKPNVSGMEFFINFVDIVAFLNRADSWRIG